MSPLYPVCAKDGVAILVTRSPLANGNTPRVVKTTCKEYGMTGERVALICTVQVNIILSWEELGVVIEIKMFWMYSPI